MRFLLGMIIGVAASVGMLSAPASRDRLADRVTQVFEQASRAVTNAGNPPRTDEGNARGQTTPPSPDLREPDTREKGQATNPIETAQRPETAEGSDESPGPNEPEGAKRARFQVAWSPFRSETSANGFAARLERQLAHEFHVVRTAPGHYEVGFEFDSDPERISVLEDIRAFTGYSPAMQPGSDEL